jgi:transcriptional regulator with XRE-family HTH domain
VQQALGVVVRRRREELGLTQEQLGFKTGLQRVYISLIERGINQPTIGVFFKLAHALHVKPSRLLAKVEVELNTDGENHGNV